MKIWNVPACSSSICDQSNVRNKNVLFREGGRGRKKDPPSFADSSTFGWNLAVVASAQLQDCACSCYNNDVVDLRSNHVHDEIGM